MSDAMTQVEQFLLLRIMARHDHETVGVSSNAMIVSALTGRKVDLFDYPRDLSDLSRCCATFAKAPWDMKERMLPILADFLRHIEAKQTASRATEREDTQARGEKA